MLLHDFLRNVAGRTPDAPAIIEAASGASCSYAELDRLANRFANLLIHSDVRRGDRVVLAFDTGIDLAAAYFGTMKAGAVAVPLPSGPRSDRFLGVVGDCAPKACIVDDRLAAQLADLPEALQECRLLVRSAHRKRGASVVGRDLKRALAEQSEDPPAVPTIDLDLAAIIYTSGSTGTPRGVMLTHRNIVSNTRSIVAYLRLTAADRVMCVLPFYYVYGLSLLHTHVAVGGSTVVDGRFAFPNVVLEAMQRYEVTGLAGVPSTFTLLLHRSNLANMTFPRLRYVTQAGGGMPPARVVEWLEKGPPVPFFVMYGATEASARLTYLPPSELRRKIGSIGRPIPNVEITIVNENGQRAAAGEVGELVARGANISIGYWNSAEETRERFGPEGYRTGDLGFADEEGFLHLVGRRHDMIKVGGHRVGAKEIEDVLHEHPDVHEAAVVGAPDDLLGEIPIAYVVLRNPQGHGTDATALQVFCRSRLANHKVPARVVFRSELPKLSGVGKIDKPVLRSLALSDFAVSTETETR